jgi:hypothetical protein
MDNFNPDHDAPIRREYCLSLKWFDDDPMPTVCALKHDHAGDHETRLHRFAVGAVDVITWAKDELEEVA